MITSTGNNRIREAKKLQRRRHRHAEGRLLVEGLRLLQDAVGAGAQPDVVFYAADLIGDNDTIIGLIHRLEAVGVECVSCSPQVFLSLAETVTPQGIAAIVPLPQLPLPERSSLALILDRLRDPGNAGTLLRSAEAAGVDRVLFAPDTVDPFNDKVVRAGMGAHFRLALRVCNSWDEVASYLAPNQSLYLADAQVETVYDQVDWRGTDCVDCGR